MCVYISNNHTVACSKDLLNKFIIQEKGLIYSIDANKSKSYLDSHSFESSFGYIRIDGISVDNRLMAVKFYRVSFCATGCKIWWSLADWQSCFKGSDPQASSRWAPQ